ncbi:hypothetical protein [Novipirellula rosea]|uniref:Ankyrin repeats (3 copies) n=1 Tax=Novipirellula rosea TaxID=1031540 RepID=A0ABP8MK80_9BACT
MPQSYETVLTKYAVPNRRGVWTTFGSGGSWESILFDAVGDDPADMFRQMTDVQSVTKIEKRDVLAKYFDSPDGAWSLLIQPQHQKWNWLAGPSTFQEIIRAIARTEPGRWLRTGYQKTSGALYVELYEAGRRRLFFSSDGAAWDEPEDDEDELDGFLEFESDDYSANWPLEYQTIDDVHQQLMIDLDAYDPCCVWDGHLFAMHSDALAEQNIARVDLIRFGSSKTTPSKRRSKAQKTTNTDLVHGIQKHDLERVRHALANDANRTKLPGTPSTAIGLAITYLNWHFPNSVKIVLAVLDAGADPNDGGFRQPNPMAILVDHSTVLATDAVGLIDSLVKAGCDFKQLSDMPWDTVKKTSLDIAVSKNRIDLVLCLLSHGDGDLDAGNSSDAIPALVEKSLQRMGDCGDIQPPPGLRAELSEFVREEYPRESMRYLAGRLAFYEEQFQRQSRDALQSLSDAVPKIMDRLTKIVRGEKNPPRKKSPVLFEPDLATAMSLPEKIKLMSVEHLDWVDVVRFSEMDQAMR